MKIEHLCKYRDHIFQKKAAVSLYEAFTCACKKKKTLVTKSVGGEQWNKADFWLP
jgi:hypothetical protein